jgi:hypothetical protein
MGDRAIVVFKDRDDVSPAVYLHWNASEVPAWLELLAERMEGRKNDASYAAARFTGICHENIPGDLSLGLFSSGKWEKAIKSGDAKKLSSYSHGDGGFVVVDCADFSWKAYGGYLEEKANA